MYDPDIDDVNVIDFEAWSRYIAARDAIEDPNVLIKRQSFFAFRNIMSLLTNNYMGKPNWLPYYWIAHPFSWIDDAGVNEPCQLSSKAISLIDFRRHMIILLRSCETNPCVFDYWLNHPISRENGDDEETISLYKICVEKRRDAHKKIRGLVYV